MKSLPTGSGSEGVLSKWKYFELLTFLNDSLAPRRVVSNISNEESQVNEESNNELQSDDDLQSQVNSDTPKSDKTQDQNTAETHVLQKPENVNSFETPKNNKKRNRSQKDPISDLLAIERQKIAHLDVIASKSQASTDIEDEDYFFLKSILPHLRSIPEHHKLQTRIKIQQLIINEKQRCNSENSAIIPAPTPSPTTSCTQDNSTNSLLLTTDESTYNNLQESNFYELRPQTSTQDFPGLIGEFLRFPSNK